MHSRVVTHRGVIDDRPASALAGILGISDTSFDGEVPPMWHSVYLLDRWRRDELGADGHPVHGMPEPPPGPHSRMFAGGRTRHVRPLRLGTLTTKTSRAIKTAEKVGSSGPLTFVTVLHEYEQNGEVAVAEEHDIVYRPVTGRPSSEARAASRPLAPGAEGSPTTASSTAVRPTLRFDVDPVTLFLFSVVTSNSHRIHYDQAFAASEGHADLVIHGPLQILLMASALRAEGHDLAGTEFSYRLLAPATGSQTLTIGAPTVGAPHSPAGATGTTPATDIEAAVASVRVADGSGRVVARGDLAQL